MPQLAVAMAERRGADETSRRLEEQLRSELHAAVERVKPFEAKGVELQRACDMMHEERHRMSRELQHALASVRGLEENLNAVSSEKRQVNHPTTYRPPRLPRSLLTLLPLVPRGMRSSPSSLGATWHALLTVFPWCHVAVGAAASLRPCSHTSLRHRYAHPPPAATIYEQRPRGRAATRRTSGLRHVARLTAAGNARCTAAAHCTARSIAVWHGYGQPATGRGVRTLYARHAVVGGRGAAADGVGRAQSALTRVVVPLWACPGPERQHTWTEIMTCHGVRSVTPPACS